MNLLGQNVEPSLIREGDPQGGGFESTSSNTKSETRSLDTVSPLISYDLISAVQSSSDSSSTITNHISDLNQAISSLTQQSRTYQSQIEQSQSKLSDCSSDKKIADVAVIEAVNTNKLENINTLIQTSVTAGQCEAQHRITINALTLITKKYTQAIASLTKKVNLIEQHKATIEQYPEVIANPEVIKELSQISSQF
jgi:prefoldin subunit 5